MIFALDTNVLLDVLYNDEDFHEASRETLEKKSQEGFFVVSPEVYSELASTFARKFDEDFGPALDDFLEKKEIAMEKHSHTSLKKAGDGWRRYEPSGNVECSGCGSGNSFECEKCGEKVSWRNHLITDFMIGAHAEEKADALITRDRGYFENYFDVKIIDPAK